MQASEINRKLRLYITEQFLDGDDADLEDDSPLLEWGVIDSVGMFSLLAHIKEEFGVEVPDREVSPRNFHSIAVLQALITRLLADQGGERA